MVYIPGPVAPMMQKRARSRRAYQQLAELRGESGRSGSDRGEKEWNPTRARNQLFSDAQYVPWEDTGTLVLVSESG